MNVLAATRPAPPLHDMLGVCFEFNAGVTALAWDRDFAFFGLADGSIAILRAHWQGAPSIAHRAGGGVEITAGTTPPPPPAIFPVHKGAVLALATDPLGGVISGGADGKVQCLIDGEINTLDHKPRRRIEAVAAGRGGRRAFANGRQVERLGPESGRLMLPAPAIALAYDPSGLHLAAGYEGGVSLAAAGIRQNPVFEAPGAFTMLAWHPNGASIAAASPSGAVLRDRAVNHWQTVENLAGAPTALAYIPDGSLIVAGANFVQVFRPGTRPEPLGAGLGAPIACHPTLNIIAATAQDGRILICRPGHKDSLLVRDAGPTPNIIAFAPDGEALAYATADGEAGTVILPNILFRAGESR